MASASGRRPHVASVELHPRVSLVVSCVLGQPEDEFGVVALLSEQAKEDQRADETRRLARSEAEGSVDGPTDAVGRVAAMSAARRRGKPSDERSERLPPDARTDKKK